MIVTANFLDAIGGVELLNDVRAIRAAAQLAQTDEPDKTSERKASRYA